MDNKAIGRLIRLRRMERGMTQDQLADAIGVSPSAIGMYENGKRRPKDEVVTALADVFNVPKWNILYSENEMIPADSVEDDEVFLIREAFRSNPQLRTLFDLQRGATTSELRQMEAFIRAIRSDKDEDTD